MLYVIYYNITYRFNIIELFFSRVFVCLDAQVVQF